MFIFNGFLVELILHILTKFFPFIVIGLIISLISRYSKKPNEYGRPGPGETLMDDAQPKPSNTGVMNILLYIGAFFIVGSILLFIRDDPKLVPAVTILVTLLSYIAGLVLYRLVHYLRPVATAFAYTAIVLFPLWYYAFTEIGLPEDASMLLGTTFSLVAYICAAVIVESKTAGWLSYIWLILFGWTIANVIDGALMTHLLGYAFFIWTGIVAIVANLLWVKRVAWLPVPFRKATKVLGEVLTPIFAAFACLMLAAPDINTNYPFLRSAALIMAITNGLICFFSSKKHSHLIALRTYIQALIVFIFADTMNYSITSSYNATGASLMMAIVWLASFLGQTICSLFAKVKDAAESAQEHAVLIISLIGIFFTSWFCIGFDAVQSSIIYIVLASVVALLGILISWRYKNINWTIATVIGLATIPLEIITGLLQATWSGWVFFAIYSTLALTLLMAYWIVTLVSVKSRKELAPAIVTIVACNIVCITATAAEEWAAIGWLNTAIDVALLAIIARRYTILEVAAYFAAASLASLISTASYKISATGDAALAFEAIGAHVIALPILIFGFIKERKLVAAPRLIIGFIAYSLPMFFIASDANDSQNYLWPLIFIIEEAIFIFIGVFTKRMWLMIASIVLTVLATLRLTGGFNGFWLLVLGVAIIAIVTWQLVKNNKK